MTDENRTESERAYLSGGVDLTPFCPRAGNDPRKQLWTPWSEGELTYATDGRVAIEVPRLAAAPTREEVFERCGNYPPNMALIFTPEFPPRDAEGTWGAASEIEIVASGIHACPMCRDGKVYETFLCPCCDGTGDQICGKCGWEHTCHRCEGYGKIETGVSRTCPDCDGDKKMRVARLPNGVEIDARLWRKVAALPGARCALGGPPARYGPLVYIIFDGGRAVTTPVKVAGEG